MKCRHCGCSLDITFVDLGRPPPSNAFLTEADLARPEPAYPLRVLVCRACWLVQTEDYVRPENLFSDEYAYFSSYSSSWLKHAEDYVAKAMTFAALTPQSMVVEVGANDGYLLQFVRAAGIPCYGIEPTASTAAAARARGIDIVPEFFGVALAEQLAAAGRSADLIAVNNVLAHVPDINDFAGGLARLLKADGVITIEFPYLPNLVRLVQFDTIYHEHYSYLSLAAVERVFAAVKLAVVEVEHLTTHGGSIRIYLRHQDAHPACGQSVVDVRASERSLGVESPEYYAGFQQRVDATAHALADFLKQAAGRGERVLGYGAAAKGNTMLNYAGIGPDVLPQVVDLNVFKQGRYLPGSRIPVCAEDALRTLKPAWILILPWNLKEEISRQLDYARAWGARFVTAIPRLDVF